MRHRRRGDPIGSSDHHSIYEEKNMKLQDLTFTGFEQLRDESGAVAFKREDGTKQQYLRIIKLEEKYIATLYNRFPGGTQVKRFTAVSPAAISLLLKPYIA